MPKTNTASGFTLIELLIVVVIIGIMSGILIVIINPQQQRARAQDGVRAGNISKLVQSIEAFRAGEGAYPTDQAQLTAAATRYVQNWPADTTYTYVSSGTPPSEFCISVPMATNTALFIRYQSVGATGISAGRVHVNCQSECPADFTSASVTGCSAL